jgi:hypothetical protein
VSHLLAVLISVSWNFAFGSECCLHATYSSQVGRGVQTNWKINYRTIIVNTVQCDSIRVFTAFTCFGQLTIFRRLDINVFKNNYYMVRNTYLELVYKNYLQLFGSKTCYYSVSKFSKHFGFCRCVSSVKTIVTDQNGVNFKLKDIYLHEGECFSRGWQSLNWSRNSPPFMETEGSVLYSQGPILNQLDHIETLFFLLILVLPFQVFFCTGRGSRVV